MASRWSRAENWGTRHGVDLNPFHDTRGEKAASEKAHLRYEAMSPQQRLRSDALGALQIVPIAGVTRVVGGASLSAAYHAAPVLARASRFAGFGKAAGTVAKWGGGAAAVGAGVAYGGTKFGQGLEGIGQGFGAGAEGALAGAGAGLGAGLDLSLSGAGAGLGTGLEAFLSGAGAGLGTGLEASLSGAGRGLGVGSYEALGGIAGGLGGGAATAGAGLGEGVKALILPALLVVAVFFLARKAKA